MTSAFVARQIQVERLSIRDELANLLRVSATIVLAVWLYLASALGDSTGVKRSLLPYQVLIENRSATEQRIFRELQEGLLEAERARSTSDAWPDVPALASDGIPPFAPDPTAKDVIYRWQMRRDGAYVNYLGIPDRAGAPAWLILVQEPEPGTPPDQAAEDEEHHRLLDGTMLHVSTWNHEGGVQIPASVVRLPQVAGWTQFYAVGPAQPASPSAPTNR